MLTWAHPHTGPFVCENAGTCSKTILEGYNAEEEHIYDCNLLPEMDASYVQGVRLVMHLSTKRADELK